MNKILLNHPRKIFTWKWKVLSSFNGGKYWYSKWNSCYVTHEVSKWFWFMNSVSYVKRYQSFICLSCVRSPLWFTMFTSLAIGTCHFYELLDIFANGFWTCCQVIWYGLPWGSSMFWFYVEFGCIYIRLVLFYNHDKISQNIFTTSDVNPL